MAGDWCHAINLSTPACSNNSTAYSPHPSPPDHPRCFCRIVQNPPQCMQAHKRIRLLNSPAQGSSGSCPCPCMPALATDCCRQAFCHWKVISSISSIGKGRNTDATLFQSNLAGRRVLVLNGGGPCLFEHSGRGRVAQVCWGGGLIHSRKKPLISSNRALDMPFKSLMGEEDI
jgi:hypothetical protein